MSCALEGVRRLHRHLGAPPGALVAFEVLDERRWPFGWATVGRPVAPALQAIPSGPNKRKGWAEVTRVALGATGTGAPSMLYGAAARWARENHQFILTYTMEGEDGASLRASSWISTGWTRGGEWSRSGRPRKPGRATGPKQRWVAPFCEREARRRGWLE